MAKRVLHYSQINMFTRCPEQFRRRYIEGETIPPAVAILVGKGMHKGIEVNLTRKMETGQMAEEEEVKSAARDSVAKAFTDGEFKLEGDETERGAKAVEGEAIDTATQLSALHRADIAPLVTPLHVERKWVLDTGNFPYDLAGTIDCDEGAIIDDWKSANKSPSKDAAEKASQLTMYALAKYQIDKIIPRVRLGVLVKNKKPKAVMLDSERTQEDLQCLLAGLERVAAAIDRQIYTFASMQDPRPWCCSPKFCGYYKTCPGVSTRCLVAVKEQ